MLADHGLCSVAVPSKEVLEVVPLLVDFASNVVRRLEVIVMWKFVVERLTPHHPLGATLRMPSRMVLLVVVSSSRGPAPMWFQMSLLLDDLALEGLHGSLRLARLDALE